ncbi:pentatricopeptide repeat protein [Aspergillus affinis]|uniref:pentatricopeptide repeat protein n=1 Tax=Aspergillus affinis TaxID=1070780 RepID=UPI0022FE92C2|nr:uncharacterized protein KD926_004949 [Aspergillus affinis]KAI9042883.1 hypothetical protein KD926_004949 [Aspergillus affinis]
MLPLGLLTAAQGHPMLVELKNGETLNGHLANCDNWMNLILKEVVQTSPEGDRFFRLPEVYIRGNNIKYLRIPEEIVEVVKEQQLNQPPNRGRGGHRGDRGDRGGRGGRGNSTSAPAWRCLSSLTANHQEHNAEKERKPEENENDTPRSRKRASRQSRRPNTRAPGLSQVPDTLKRKPTARLEAQLQELTAKRPKVVGAVQILRALIRDRHVRPDTRHYKALILANTDSERGSPENVRDLLSEMEANKITADSGTLHAALQVLAVHPDYILRQEILHTLRDRWLPLSPTGWHYVVAGLVRENQFELALDHLEKMEVKEIMVENWLYSLFIYYLCDFEEFDEVVRLMRLRASRGHDMTPDLWLYVLDAASAATHHEATYHVWRQMVELRYLKPSHGICRNVLTTALHAGNTKLATSVIEFLVEIDVEPGLEDYERLAETHLRTGDLCSGFEVWCQMHAEGITLEESSTDAFLTHMIQSRSHPRDAWAMLKRLKELGYEIPLRCALVVIQTCEREALADPSIVDDGIALYKELYALCPTKADASIYNSLIGMCRRARAPDPGMFVVNEMASLGVVPDSRTFQHLIVICLDAGNFQSALMYFQDMLDRKFTPDEDVCVEIRELCSGSSSEYALQLRYHPLIRDEVIQLPRHDTESPADSPLLFKILSDPPPEYSHRQIKRPKTQEEQRAQRRAESKESRKRKRRRLAIAKTRAEEGWEDYEPGGLIPESEFTTLVRSIPKDVPIISADGGQPNIFQLPTPNNNNSPPDPSSTEPFLVPRDRSRPGLTLRLWTQQPGVLKPPGPSREPRF